MGHVFGGTLGLFAVLLVSAAAGLYHKSCKEDRVENASAFERSSDAHATTGCLVDC
jgi:hypothetical protein